MRGEFMCVTCGHKASELYKEHSSEVLRLLRCKKCDEVVDKYIEFDLTIVLIDIILQQQQAYRHVLFNVGPKPFWKLAVIFLLCDAYTLWTAQKQDNLWWSHLTKDVGSTKRPLDCQAEQDGSMYPTFADGRAVDHKSEFSVRQAKERRKTVDSDKEVPVGAKGSVFTGHPSFGDTLDKPTTRARLVGLDKREGTDRTCSNSKKRSGDEKDESLADCDQNFQKIELEWDFYIMACISLLENAAFLGLVVSFTRIFENTLGVWSWATNQVLVHGMVVASCGKLLAIPALVWGQSDSSIYLALAWLFIWLSQVHVYQAVCGVTRSSAIFVVTVSQAAQFVLRWILLQIVDVL